ncbi:unnamed protein product [Brugia timori]|uniref:Uncharacterized protein n=1 Tax=Brugia timori TaxID=42155 RepID=A0A0R3QIS5_9BILA|nr:unnamed protein product [Brugia timori]
MELRTKAIIQPTHLKVVLSDCNMKVVNVLMKLLSVINYLFIITVYHFITSAYH